MTEMQEEVKEWTHSAAVIEVQNIFNIICVLFFLWQLFFGVGWAAVFCRLLVGGCVVYWLVCKYRLNKQGQEQAKLGKEQPAAVNKEAVQGTKADAKDSVAHAAQQEGSKWVGSEVEMMDGPYGRAPFGGVIWDDEYTIDELIFKNGVYYYNQNSEEWEEDDEDAWAWSS